MEIRRKVFSLLQDENGEERYYSTNEFEMEFDEETGEKMFSEKEEKKGMSKGGKIALGTTGALVAGVGALELANLLKKKHLSKAELAQLKSLEETVGLSKNELKAYIKDMQAGHKGIDFVEKGNKRVADATRWAGYKIVSEYRAGKARAESRRTNRLAKKAREAVAKEQRKGAIEAFS